MIRTPGRFITVGEACQKLNPHLFKTLDPEAKVLLTNEPMENPKKKRIRQSSRPLMNELEKEFYDQLPAKEHILIQAVRFRLANGLWYKPDFVFWMGPIAYEVKGKHAFRGGFENLKVAASLYPSIMWMLVWKDNGQWRVQRVLP